MMICCSVLSTVLATVFHYSNKASAPILDLKRKNEKKNRKLVEYSTVSIPNQLPATMSLHRESSPPTKINSIFAL